jgi:flagellar biosynthesis protein FliR
MHVDLTLNFSLLYGFLLVLARVSGVIAFVPIPGVSAGPQASRIVLAVALTIALFPVWPAPAVDGPVVGRLLGWMAGEAAFGLTVGVAIAFLLEGIQMAAQMIGLQAGYSFASTVDPSTQADTTSLQILAQLLAGSLFFAFGFDREIIRILAQSLVSVPAEPMLWISRWWTP